MTESFLLLQKSVEYHQQRPQFILMVVNGLQVFFRPRLCPGSAGGGAYGAPKTLYSDGIPLHDLVHNASPDF